LAIPCQANLWRVLKNKFYEEKNLILLPYMVVFTQKICCICSLI